MGMAPDVPKIFVCVFRALAVFFFFRRKISKRRGAAGGYFGLPLPQRPEEAMSALSIDGERISGNDIRLQNGERRWMAFSTCCCFCPWPFPT